MEKSFVRQVAIVTGGTCGIGAAIAQRFQDGGTRLQQFTIATWRQPMPPTGTPVLSPTNWMLLTGVNAVVKDLGRPAGILMNNARITQDAILHEMTAVVRDRRDRSYLLLQHVPSCHAPEMATPPARGHLAHVAELLFGFIESFAYSWSVALNPRPAVQLVCHES
jgi:hypothetical protein